MIRPASSQYRPLSETPPNRLPEPVAEPEAACEHSNKPPVLVSGLRKAIYLSGAGLFFCLGVMGAILPGLPATPFLLLTSYFLVRTSPRLNAALLRSRLFGPILHDWQVHGGVRRHVKIKAVVFVVLAVGLTVALSSLSLWPKLSVALLACVGIGVIVKLPIAE